MPILIRIPTLAGGRTAFGAAPTRRRLRHEVRVAGCLLLALIPPVVACTTWSGHRPATLLAVNSPDRPVAWMTAESEAAGATISLSLEPAVAVQPAPDAVSSVSLSGLLLPADPAEEPDYGGH